MTIQNPPPTLESDTGKKHFSKSMRDIVAKCLVKDPNKRPSAAQLLEHKFFKVRLITKASRLLRLLQCKSIAADRREASVYSACSRCQAVAWRRIRPLSPRWAFSSQESSRFAPQRRARSACQAWAAVTLILRNFAADGARRAVPREAPAARPAAGAAARGGDARRPRTWPRQRTGQRRDGRVPGGSQGRQQARRMQLRCVVNESCRCSCNCYALLWCLDNAYLV